MSVEHLRFPIGRYKPADTFSHSDVGQWIETIASFPHELRELVESISEEDMERTYRPGSWTIRQIVHHLADSHLNSYIRFKWTLTEEAPVVIKPYEERLWAEQPEAREAPVQVSLNLLEALHARWVLVLRNLTEAQLMRTFYHPEQKREYALWWIIGMYAWHCRHHDAHIRLAMEMEHMN